MVLQKVTIKRVDKMDECNRRGIKVRVIDSDGNAISPFSPKYIAKPPTIEWYTVNEGEPTSKATKKSGELVLDSLASLSIGHNTAIFKYFSDHKGVVPLEEMCFSIKSSGHIDKDKLDNRSLLSSHWNGNRTLDLVARSILEAHIWSNAFTTVIELARNLTTSPTSKSALLFSIDLDPRSRSRST